MRRSELKRRAPMKRSALGPGAKSLARRSTFKPPDRTASRPVKFRARIPARTQRCFRCPKRAHVHHHWIPQEHLRTHVKRMRLDEAQERRVLRDLLRDERNLSPMCTPCHLDAEHGNKPFRPDEIPASAFVFARELGAWAVARLDRIGTR